MLILLCLEPYKVSIFSVAILCLSGCTVIVLVLKWKIYCDHDREHKHSCSSYISLSDHTMKSKEKIHIDPYCFYIIC